MKSRVLISVLLIALALGLNVYLHQSFTPEQATDLALKQMNEDGSREKLRVIEQMSNWIEVGLAAVALAGIYVIWIGKIRERRRIKKIACESSLDQAAHRRQN